MAGQVRRGIERGGPPFEIRTAIHNIREPVTEFSEPRRNKWSCSLKFYTEEGTYAFIGASQA